MSSLSSVSGYAGNPWQLALMNRSSVGAGASMSVADADGDSDGSAAPSAATGSAAAGSASGGTGSPLSLLTSDLQSLLTALQDVANSGASGTPSSTATSGKGPAGLFAKVDSNGDGSISKAEWEAGAPQGVTTAQADQRFASIDANGDGSISQTELQTALAHGHHGHHAHAAATGDSTAKLTNDVATLLQDLQGMNSGTSADGSSTGATDIGTGTMALNAFASASSDGSTQAPAAGSGNNVNDQLAKMLADLQKYLQGQTSTLQVSA